MLKLGQNYDLLCNMIIRPPRFVYDIADLGPKHFSLFGKPAQRTDFELVNARGMVLQCSHFEPLLNWGQPMPCVIYLHGNGGCRLEALDAVRTLVPCNMSVFALDFAGSGLSDGEYVSLGAWERYDVATVVKYLRETQRCSTIGLWGRSMGAVTAILYSTEDPSIASMLLDSPFCSLTKIAEDLVMNVEALQRMPRFTRFAVSVAMRAIRSTIKKRAKFDTKHLEILDSVSKCFIPALFVHSRGDNFVSPLHSELLHGRYGGDKNRILVEGDHNSSRPNFFMDSAAIFFMTTLNPSDPIPSNTPYTSLVDPPEPALESLPNAQTGQGDVAPEELGAILAGEGLPESEPKGEMSESIVIDDIVIGNSVMIDGEEVHFSQPDYFNRPSTPPASPPPNHTPPTTNFLSISSSSISAPTTPRTPLIIGVGVDPRFMDENASPPHSPRVRVRARLAPLSLEGAFSSSALASAHPPKDHSEDSSGPSTPSSTLPTPTGLSTPSTLSTPTSAPSTPNSADPSSNENTHFNTASSTHDASSISTSTSHPEVLSIHIPSTPVDIILTPPLSDTNPSSTYISTPPSSPPSEATQYEPAYSEPAQSEPAHSEPVHSEPVHSEPAQSEPAQSEPAQSEPAQAELAETEPLLAEPTQSESVHSEVAHAEPTHAEPTYAERTYAEPAHAEPTHAKPTHAEPTHAEPTHAEPTHAEPTHAEPVHVEPAHAEPTHVEPAHAEPTHVEPSHAEPSHAHAEPSHAEPSQPSHAEPSPHEQAHAEPSLEAQQHPEPEFDSEQEDETY